MNLTTASKLDLLIAEAQGKVKVTRLPISHKGAKSASRSWAPAAPKGSFLHGAISDAAAVTNNNKASKAC